MATHTIKVPDVGEGVAEVELVAWAVAVGDTVTRNQVLAEVMTDKANVEIPCPVDGVIAGLHGEVGETLAVGSDLIGLTVDAAVAPSAASGPTAAATPVPLPVEPRLVAPPVIAPSDRGITLPFPQLRSRRPANSAPIAATTAPAQALPLSPATVDPATVYPATVYPATVDPATVYPATVDPATVYPATVDPATVYPATVDPATVYPATVDPATVDPGMVGQTAVASASESGGRTRAVPAVRLRARQLAVDLATVTGSGPEGRVLHADLDRHLLGSQGPASNVGVARLPPTAGDATRTEALVGLRRQIAQRMVTATTTIPHITYVEEVDVTALEQLRSTLNAERQPTQPKLTLLPFLIRALVSSIAEHPKMNAHVDDNEGTVTFHDGVHVGVATQTDRGLLVPVIRNAEAETLWSLADQLGRLAGAARDRSATAAELSGSTITISSLGALGGLATTPVINKPEVAVIGVNKIATRPVWQESAFVPRKIMNLSSSFDHRVIDGWDAATFVQLLRRLLEQPALLFAPWG